MGPPQEQLRGHLPPSDGSKPTLTDAQQQVLLPRLKKQPALTLEAMIRRLLDHLDVRLGTSSVSRHLLGVGYSPQTSLSPVGIGTRRSGACR